MYPFSGIIPTRPSRHDTTRRFVIQKKRPSFSISRLIEAACAVNGVSIEHVKRDGRKREIAVSWAVEHIAILSVPYSHGQVGRMLRRDQSCISHAKRRSKAHMQDAAYVERLEAVRKMINL
jgi:chromosomal replication initiation ATPase DnaA